MSDDHYGEGARFLRRVLLTLSPLPKDVVVSEFNAMFPESGPATFDYSAMATLGVYLKVRWPPVSAVHLHTIIK